MSDVINMIARSKLIREAQEARELRKAEREAEDKRLPPVRFPGGIDDMEV